MKTLATFRKAIFRSFAGFIVLITLGCPQPPSQLTGTSTDGHNIEICPDCPIGTPVQQQKALISTQRPQHSERVANMILNSNSILPAKKMAATTEQGGNKPKVRAYSLGVDPTAGMVIDALNSAISGLEDAISKASADIKSVGNSLDANAKDVLAQLNYYLGDKLNDTFDKLSEQEKRLAEDAENLIDQTKNATLLITNNAKDAAIIAAQEADITAYDSVNSLPCKNKVPRLVYVTPSSIELNSQTESPEVKIRGNFLNYGNPDIKVNNQPVNIISTSANEYTIEIPNAVINNITDERSLQISAVCNKCTVSPLGSSIQATGTVQSLALKIIPIQSYSLLVHITPLADIPTENDYEFSPYDHTEQKCDASDVHASMNWNLPNPGWTYLSHVLENLQINQKGSGIVSQTPTPNGVVVEDTVSGAGCVWPSSGCGPGTWCKGRGWVKYTAKIHYKAYTKTSLPGFSATEPNSQNTTYSYAYDRSNIPIDAQNIKWIYDVTVNIGRGNQKNSINLSDANPNGSDSSGDLVKTYITGEGKLSVEITK